MASPAQVKQYLTYWFQLGKKLVVPQAQLKVLPQPVIQGDRYSSEFESYWERIISGEWKNCYLEGTVQTIEQLLLPSWEISACARCSMPVPMLSLGVRDIADCPCFDLPFWPDNELPLPRAPIDTQSQLSLIRDRLLKAKSHSPAANSDASEPEPNLDADPVEPTVSDLHNRMIR